MTALTDSPETIVEQKDERKAVSDSHAELGFERSESQPHFHPWLSDGLWGNQEALALAGALLFTKHSARVTAMNCSLQNTCCPSLQASPSLQRSHSFCSSDVRLSLTLPRRSLKSQYFFTTISLSLCQPALSQTEASLWARPWSEDLHQREPSLTQPGPAAWAGRKVAGIWGRFVTVV